VRVWQINGVGLEFPGGLDRVGKGGEKGDRSIIKEGALSELKRKRYRLFFGLRWAT